MSVRIYQDYLNAQLSISDANCTVTKLFKYSIMVIKEIVNQPIYFSSVCL